MMKYRWIDSRIKKPSCNSFDSYMVTFLNSRTGITFLGFADWSPKDEYTDGVWENVRCTNGNKIGGEVLYWLEHPLRPELPEVESRFS